VFVSGENKILVDFIGDNGHAVAQAYFTHARKFIGFPNASDRIMRIAQNKHFCLFDFFLKILKIYTVMSA